MKELVIKLSDEVYEDLTKYGQPLPSGNRFHDAIMSAVANGKQLPKGHGRLIDADKAKSEDNEEPKIKVLDRDEVIRKLGAVDVYRASAWVTLLEDVKHLGLKICEVEE